MKALLVGPENPHFIGHLRTLQCLDEVSEIHLAACDDGDAPLLEEARLAHPAKVMSTGADVATMLQHHKFDFVVGCPRNDRCASVYERVLGAGIPLLAEKPIGRNAAEVVRVVEQAHRAAVPLGVFYVNRLHPAVQAARNFVRDGLLGELMAVELRWYTTQPKFRDPKHWLFNRAQSGGGIVQWLGCHLIDLAHHVTGEEITNAAGALATRSGEAIDVEDAAAIIMKFSGGAVGSLDCGFVLAQSGAGYYNRAGNDTHVAFIGTQGRVWWTPTESPCVVHFESTQASWAHAPRRELQFELPESPAYGGVHGLAFVQAFMRATQGAGAPVATGEDALRVARITDLIYANAIT